MLKRSGFVTLVAFTAAISFSTASYAGAKKDCAEGMKEVEAQFAQASGMGGGGKKKFEAKLRSAQEAMKNGKFKACKKRVGEMKKLMVSQ